MKKDSLKPRPGNPPAEPKQLSPKELAVLENLFSDPSLSLSDAVRNAGYKIRSTETRCNVARRALEKYESLAGGREIMRRAGLGEARVALKLRRLIEDLEARYYDQRDLAAAKTLLKALELASKCLGLQREVIEGMEAPVIVISGRTTVEAGGGRPGQGGGETEVEAVQAQIRGRLTAPPPPVEEAEIRD